MSGRFLALSQNPSDGAWNPLSNDLRSLVGPRIATPATSLTADSSGRVIVSSGATVSGQQFLDTWNGSSGIGVVFVEGTNETIVDCDIQVSLRVLAAADAGLTSPSVTHSYIHPTIHSQAWGGLDGAVTNNYGYFGYNHVFGAVDGIYPSGPCLVEYNIVESFVTYGYYDGPLYTGAVQTAAVAEAIFTNLLTDGATVTADELFSVNTSGSNYGYQVISGGTLGSPLIASWPITPGTTFTSGTATIWCIGNVYHSDAAQSTWFPFSCIFRRNSLQGFTNSAGIYQNFATAGGYDGFGYPGGAWIIEENLIAAGANQWMYVQLETGGDPSYGNTAYGGYARDPTAHTWSLQPDAYKGRPRGLIIRNNVFGDRGTLDGVLVSGGSGLRPTQLTDVMFDTTYPFGSEDIVWVPDVNTWLGAVARQYDTTPSDPNITEMLAYSDPETGSASVATVSNAEGAGLTVDPTVLANRYALGLMPGNCDARCWSVWQNNTNQAGAQLYPRNQSLPWQGANGYALPTI